MLNLLSTFTEIKISFGTNERIVICHWTYEVGTLKKENFDAKILMRIGKCCAMYSFATSR